MFNLQNKESDNKSYDKGLKIENQVSIWLSQVFGLKCKERDLVNGKNVKKPYEVAVHAIKKAWFSATHIWVECKVHRIKRSNVSNFISSVKDVKECYNSGLSQWKPDILMMVSLKGYDVDALGWANNNNIFCVEAEPQNFKFIGNLSRKNFQDSF